MQDSRSRTPAKPWNAHARVDPKPAPARLRVLLLGMNVWVIGVLWPLLGVRTTSALEIGLGFASPLPLWLGASALGARLGARPFAWLVAFPAALAAAIAARPEALNRELYGPFGLVLLAGSLCAYGASAIAALAPEAHELEATHRPLGPEPRDARDAIERRREQLLVGSSVLGAALLALVAPHLGADELERAFGDAADSGAVLSAVVGGALAIAVVAVYLGNGLRADVAEVTSSDRTRRAFFYLMLAALSVVTYVVVQP